MSENDPTKPTVEAVEDFRTAATVHIFMKNGDLDVDVKKAKVKAGGSITFKLRGGEKQLETFAVLMLNRTPIKNEAISAGGTRGKPVTCPIDENAEDDEPYSYCVIASDGTRSYHLDPDIVVGPPGGG